MERKAKGKGYKRSGAPFAMAAMGVAGMMGGGTRRHEKAHKRMGMNQQKNKEEDSLKKTEDAPVEAEAETKPGKAPENKKEE